MKKTNVEIDKKCVIYNAVCAGVCWLILLFFFAPIIGVDLNGDNYNISGFDMAFGVFSNGVPSEEILGIVNDTEPDAVNLALGATLFALLCTLAMFVLFTIRAIFKKPILSKVAIGALGLTLVAFIVNVTLVSQLCNIVETVHTNCCATCEADSMGFLGILILIALGITYTIMSYNLYDRGVTFRK
jgi:hypothetical protein